MLVPFGALVYIQGPLFVFLVLLTIFGICFLPLGYLLLVTYYQEVY